ncbi:MAG: hypothetical protein GQ583_04320 [Methyloprofundus sp.]|nr:hypothetical protein [Methyloprofundus sp.]
MTDEIFSLEENTVANQRKAIRYFSNHNQAHITLKKLFRPSKNINIKIINISSRGARISSEHKLSIKAKIIFDLPIKGSSMEKVSAKVVSLYNNTEYGIAFDSIQHDLIDQIMEHEDDFNIA